MLAERVALEEEGVAEIPPHLSFEEGATLPCAAVSIWNAMMEHGRLKAGDTILLQGTGGVLIFGLQFARAIWLTFVAVMLEIGVAWLDRRSSLLPL
jgi:NADPH:quinone reductase-like Zn-dependent oxidoreductase